MQTNNAMKFAEYVAECKH